MSKQQNTRGDYVVFGSKLSAERMTAAYKRIAEILPAFRLGERVSLKDLDAFLTTKYRAEKADWKDTVKRCSASAKLMLPTTNIIART